MSSLKAPPRCARIANATPLRQRQSSRDLGRLLRRVHRDRVVRERLVQLRGDTARLRRGAVGLRDHHEGAPSGRPNGYVSPE